MKKLSAIVVSTLIATTLTAQSAIGTWETVNDKDGQVQSHIEIYEKSGKLYGRIIKTLDPDAGETCTTCTDYRANKPFLGMEIITAAAPDGEKQWAGKIFDPEADTEYKLVMWLEKDPNVLYVRGKHWTGLYRTQTWKRL